MHVLIAAEDPSRQKGVIVDATLDTNLCKGNYAMVTQTLDISQETLHTCVGANGSRGCSEAVEGVWSREECDPRHAALCGELT